MVTGIEAVRPVNGLVHKIKVTDKETVRSVRMSLHQKVHSLLQLCGSGGARKKTIIKCKDIFFLGSKMSQHGGKNPTGQENNIIDQIKFIFVNSNYHTTIGV